MTFTVEDAKRVQRDLGLGDRHVVYTADGTINGWGFVMAHTDAERASGASLWDCWVHQWLCEHDWMCRHCFPADGWYEITDCKVQGLAL